MRLDPQVGSIEGVQPEALLAMVLADSLYRRLTGREVRITSVKRPGDPRLHGKGRAFDCGCQELAGPIHDLVLSELRAMLKPLGYDVVHETPESHGTPEHIHVEFDPR